MSSKKRIAHFAKSDLNRKTIICIAAGVLAIAIVAGIVLFALSNSKVPALTTISQSSLEKVIEINDLSTLDYTYNAIAKVYDTDNTTLKYHVAYEGTVTAGIDITKVKIETDEESKKIVITIPDAMIQSVRVEMETLDFIFEDKDYETETVSQEAYKASLEDLEKRANEEQDLLSMARDNAVAAVKALISPWVEQIDQEYDVEVK